MSSEHTHSYVHLYEECQTRIQTIGELLLIPCKPQPVFTHKNDLAATNDNFVHYRDQVISHLNRMLIHSRDVSSHIHAGNIQWKSFEQPITDITSTIVQLTQLSAHIAYLLSLNIHGSKPAIVGPVASRHRLVQADLELKFICTRLKHSHVADLNPHMLVDMCSTVTKCLSSMTEICREAADKIVDSSEQDQFKLCIKAITSTTGCLVSSVKSFKHAANDNHLQRVISFCQPVVSTSAALLAFATEEQFLGSPAELNDEANEMYKSVLGLAMSMVSACVQITKAAQDLVHDPSLIKHKTRVSLCVESISRAASRLRDLLLSYEYVIVQEVMSSVVIKQEEDVSNLIGQLSFQYGKDSDLVPSGDGNSIRDSNDLSQLSSLPEEKSSRHSFRTSSESSSLKSSPSKSKRHPSSHHNDAPSSSLEEPHPALLIPRQAFQQTSESNSSSSFSSASQAVTSIPNLSDDSVLVKGSAPVIPAILGNGS